MTTNEAQQSVGLARWRAECAGEIEPPPELRDRRRRYGWSRQQISLAFEALAGITVHQANGFNLLSDRDLTSREAANLMNEQLIRLDRDGWALTRKGEELLSLLHSYGDPQHQWGRPRIRV